MLSRRHLLLLLTPATFIVSYLYLTLYHDQLNLWHVIIHESGKLTFYQTTFYTSHFLGHVLVYGVISMVLAGYYQSMSGKMAPRGRSWKVYGLIALVILLLSFVHSYIEFGSKSTWAYITQQMQDENNRYPGNGSWNLHLVSTITLVMAIPFYIVLTQIWTRERARFHRTSLQVMGVGMISILLITLVINRGSFTVFVDLLKDGRHLAHSARELVTFGLIYFPVTLFFLKGNSDVQLEEVPWKVLMLTFALAFIPVTYQVIEPLRIGIDNLAQTPSFAHNGRLSIAYLLASHFFEHFVDSLFFVSLTLFWFYAFRRKAT